jgi:hypothetical protein
MSAATPIGRRFIGRGYPVYLIAELSPITTKTSGRPCALARRRKRLVRTPLSSKPKRLTRSPSRATGSISGSEAARCGMSGFCNDLYSQAYTPREWQPPSGEVWD